MGSIHGHMICKVPYNKICKICSIKHHHHHFFSVKNVRDDMSGEDQLSEFHVRGPVPNQG
jgi:hypothetical protein